MGTRSSIAILNDDGIIRSIICHYDGYIHHCGDILYHNYDNECKINELIMYGGILHLKNISSINEYVNGGWLTFEKHENIESWVNHYSYVEYYYIFINGEWYVKSGVSDNKLMSFKIDSGGTIFFIKEYEDDGNYSNGLPINWGN